MASKLTISEIGPEGVLPLGALDGQELLIGREAPTTGSLCLVLKSDAVSREHGVFTPLRSHWLYKDLGSTNGSWLNGLPLKTSQWRLVRSGDVLQIADRAVQLGAASGAVEDSYGALPSPSMRSLIVFQRGQFLEEFPIPEVGRALSIGGSKSDLKLDVDVQELPSLVLERRGDRVCVFSIAKEPPIYVNDREIVQTTNLNDRDEIRIASYSLILNDAGALPSSVRHSSGGQQAGSQPGSPVLAVGSPAARGWGDTASPSPASRSSAKSLFGDLPIGDNDRDLTRTVALDPAFVQARLASREGMAARGGMMEEREAPSYEVLGEKVIAFVGWVLLMMLMMLMVWWLVSAA